MYEFVSVLLWNSLYYFCLSSSGRRIRVEFFLPQLDHESIGWVVFQLVVGHQLQIECLWVWFVCLCVIHHCKQISSSDSFLASLGNRVWFSHALEGLIKQGLFAKRIGIALWWRWRASCGDRGAIWRRALRIKPVFFRFFHVKIQEGILRLYLMSWRYSFWCSHRWFVPRRFRGQNFFRQRRFKL